MGNNCFKQHSESEALRTSLGICPAEVNRVLKEQRKIYERKYHEYVAKARQRPETEFTTHQVEIAQEAHITLNEQPCNRKLPAQNTQATQTEYTTQSALPSQSVYVTQSAHCTADPTQTPNNVPATQSVQIAQNAHAEQGVHIARTEYTVRNVQAPQTVPILHAYTAKNALSSQETQVKQTVKAPQGSHAHLMTHKHSTHCTYTQNVQTAQIAQTMQTTEVALQAQSPKNFAVQRTHTAQKLLTVELSQAAQTTQTARAYKKCNVTQKAQPLNLPQPLFIYNSNINSGDETSWPKISQDIRVNGQDSTGDKKCQKQLDPRNTKPIVKRPQDALIYRNLPDATQACSETARKFQPNINNCEKMSRQQHQTQIWRKGNKTNCCTCKMRFGLQIYECSNHHSSCSDCKDEGRTCGICRMAISTLTSSTTQKMFRTNIVPCPHRFNGCVLHFKESEMDAHKQECPYQGLPCPTGCPSILQLKRLSSHFHAVHPEQHSVLVGSEIQLRDISKDSRNVYLVLVDKIHFLFYVVVSVRDRRIYMAGQIVSTKFSALKWCYEVHVYNTSEGRNFIFVDSCSSYFEPLAEIIKEGKCCVIPHAYASNFVKEGALTYKFFIKKVFEKKLTRDFTFF